MEAIIIYSTEFHDSIEELIKVLYLKEYFGFEVDCQLYAQKIYDFVDYHVMSPSSRETPEQLLKFGSRFIKYKANNRTTWYIFFDQNEQRFLINHIINNHSYDFPELF